MAIMTRSRTREAERLQLQVAEEELPLLRKALLCPCCEAVFSNPTTLSCGHTICLGCLPSSQAPVCPLVGCGKQHSDRQPKLDVAIAKTVEALENSTANFNVSEMVLPELECQLCYMIFLEPVTASCGHTTCKQCLLRSLDYSDKCPVCRFKLPSYRHFSKHPPNNTITSITTRLFPHILSQRLEALSQEVTNRVDETPLFVCSLVFPKMPCYLHVFESRYRLMIRRCLESSRQRFGMVLHSNQGVGFHEYGTMVEARNIEMLQDGRYMVDAIGSFRFRIIERGVRDGYNIGRIERIEDDDEDAYTEPQPPLPETSVGSYPDDCNAVQKPTIQQLQAECVYFVEALKTSSAPWLYQRLNATVGPMPTEASDFSFWMASIIPLDEQEKYEILPVTSTRERLVMVLQWIRRIKEQWWFGRMCAVM
ncbi:hypothetical protein DSO57_1033354 [Entomophthora muscae]|uniref:Uncharacterized protein n=1 Tax=Entomophthora muscae TaxID=34485 RepID=A0ACC2SD76_9FUNG|nr:hypothetical protein DSO57_1033354 [Entomophthora muscae]